MQSEEEKPKAAKEDKRKFNEISVGGRQASVISETLRCPECESSLISKPIGPTLVIISIAVFVLILALGVLVRASGLEKAQGVFLPALAISVLAIFVTSCAAFAGRHRCLSCGHRFRSMIMAKRQWMGRMGSSFPWRFVIFNAVIIFIICISSRKMLELIFEGAFSTIITAIILALIGTFFWMLLSLGYQVLVYKIFRKRIRRDLLWAVLFILPAIVLGTSWLYVSLPTVNARRILNLAELAPLPESATDIKVYEWSFIFSGEKYLRFRASPSDIEKFLKESPILQDAECEKFPADGIRARSPNPNAPDWYKGDIKKGRLYIIRPKWGYYPGQVVVDDEEHFVYVNIIWS